MLKSYSEDQFGEPLKHGKGAPVDEIDRACKKVLNQVLSAFSVFSTNSARNVCRISTATHVPTITTCIIGGGDVRVNSSRFFHQVVAVSEKLGNATK